jgi:transposase
MSLAELVITSVAVGGRTKREVARDYKVSRCWVYQLVRRYEAAGEAAFQARSRRPRTSPQAVGPQIEDRIVRLRKPLSRHGLDAGAETIRVHLLRDRSVDRVPAVSAIWRI